MITYDRRGSGKSSQPWIGYHYDYDTLAADLHALLEHLDLDAVTILGFSLGGGEVGPDLGTYESGAVIKAVYVSAIPPFPHVTDETPEGIWTQQLWPLSPPGFGADRIAFVDAFGTGIFSVNGRTDLVSEAHRRDTVNIAASASPKGALDYTQAFSLTCFRDDLARDHDPDSRHPRQRRRDRPIRAERAPRQLGIAGNSLAPMRDVPHG